MENTLKMNKTKEVKNCDPQVPILSRKRYLAAQLDYNYSEEMRSHKAEFVESTRIARRIKSKYQRVLSGVRKSIHQCLHSANQCGCEKLQILTMNFDDGFRDNPMGYYSKFRFLASVDPHYNHEEWGPLVWDDETQLDMVGFTKEDFLTYLPGHFDIIQMSALDIYGYSDFNPGFMPYSIQEMVADGWNHLYTTISTGHPLSEPFERIPYYVLIHIITLLSMMDWLKQFGDKPVNVWNENSIKTTTLGHPIDQLGSKFPEAAPAFSEMSKYFIGAGAFRNEFFQTHRCPVQTKTTQIDTQNTAFNAVYRHISHCLPEEIWCMINSYCLMERLVAVGHGVMRAIRDIEGFGPSFLNREGLLTSKTQCEAHRFWYNGSFWTVEGYVSDRSGFHSAMRRHSDMFFHYVLGLYEKKRLIDLQYSWDMSMMCDEAFVRRVIEDNSVITLGHVVLDRVLLLRYLEWMAFVKKERHDLWKQRRYDIQLLELFTKNMLYSEHTSRDDITCSFTSDFIATGVNSSALATYNYGTKVSDNVHYSLFKELLSTGWRLFERLSVDPIYDFTTM